MYLYQLSLTDKRGIELKNALNKCQTIGEQSSQLNIIKNAVSTACIPNNSSLDRNE